MATFHPYYTKSVQEVLRFRLYFRGYTYKVDIQNHKNLKNVNISILTTGPLGSIYNFLSRHFCKNWCVIWKFNWHSFEPLYISSWMILKWFLIYGLISYKWPLIAKGLILAVPTCIWKWIYNNLSLNFLPQFGSFLVKIHFCIIFRKIDALRGCWGQILFM